LPALGEGGPNQGPTRAALTYGQQPPLAIDEAQRWPMEGKMEKKKKKEKITMNEKITKIVNINIAMSRITANID